MFGFGQNRTLTGLIKIEKALLKLIKKCNNQANTQDAKKPENAYKLQALKDYTLYLRNTAEYIHRARVSYAKALEIESKLKK
ncbi:MAG: hypothetical protein QXK37_03235 [Candidatus Woesearchaeota archaeon]